MQEWQKPETLTLWIIIVAAFLIVMLIFIIFLTRSIFQKMVRTKMNESRIKLEHQKSLLENSVQTQEKERKRVAEDIHDDLIGKLSALQIESQIKDPDSNSTKLIGECISTARRISHDLSPPLLEFTSIHDLIEDLMEPWKKMTQINVHKDIRNELDHSNDMKIHLIRILQEQMTNISKYAEATNVNLQIRQSENYFAIRISDNGKGFDLSEKKKGLGLRNVETRVQYLRGAYKMNSEIGKGTSTLFIFKN